RNSRAQRGRERSRRRRRRHRHRLLPPALQKSVRRARSGATKPTRLERKPMKKVTKAVFPLAPSLSAPGPMAMTRLSDRPLIQNAIEEALEAGIAEMVFVSGP